MRRFRYEYGAGVLHLVGVVASFAVASYGLLRFVDSPAAYELVAWLLGAIVLHDLVLFPLYSVADRVARRGTRRRGHREGHAPERRVTTINHVRVPALLSGLMLLVWFPLIFGLAEPTYVAATGQTTDGYLARWLILTGALFAASALSLAFRLARRKAR